MWYQVYETQPDGTRTIISRHTKLERAQAQMREYQKMGIKAQMCPKLPEGYTLHDQ